MIGSGYFDVLLVFAKGRSHTKHVNSGHAAAISDQVQSNRLLQERPEAALGLVLGSGALGFRV